MAHDQVAADPKRQVLLALLVICASQPAATIAEVKRLSLLRMHAVARALWRLHTQGLARRVARGQYAITEKGRQSL